LRGAAPPGSHTATLFRQEEGKTLQTASRRAWARAAPARCRYGPFSREKGPPDLFLSDFTLAATLAAL